MTTITPELVTRIQALIEAWGEADRRLRRMPLGWAQSACRAGLAHGFYRELALLPGIDTVFDGAPVTKQAECHRSSIQVASESDSTRALDVYGRAVYAAYRASM
jgi:hypothetical protein